MSDSAIEVRGLAKCYRVTGAPKRIGARTLRDAIVERAAGLLGRQRVGAVNASAARDFWALRDVDLTVHRGEVLGIIGQNGAGKSTLMKILARITDPTAGEATIRGRVGSLLEVGTGFHPELSGRENIFLNGAILGMRRREIAARLDAIVDFAGVGEFLDTPIKRYSSGMYVRLAFAVAAHLEPEILLVDEVLAVGDAAFQKKCLGKMDDVARSGRTVLFVSHNMAAVQSLCKRVVWLDGGTVVRDGSASGVVEEYLATVAASSAAPLEWRTDRQGDGSLRIVDIETRGGGGAVRCGDSLRVRLSYRAAQPPRHVAVSIGVFNNAGQCLLLLGNEMAGQDFAALPHEGWLTCEIPRVPLAPGRYYLNVFAQVKGTVADWVQHAADLQVDDGDFYGTGRLPPATHGGCLADHTWSAGSTASELPARRAA